ncbi:HAMP domain-containing protein [Clostridium bovifaecis]|uniref:HAMP domain-containing protein n=1 Tax=Clostridium bovifaecis TaxID=2184719 RepID=A0A6I6EVB1_9CLOT|nr:HAMP domain-containing protein [Clostridium bovifaecis]
MKNLRLSYKLLIFVFTLSVIPLMIIFVNNYNTVNNLLNKRIYELMDEKANAKVNEINQWFIGKKDEVSAMANVPLLRKGATPEERTTYTAYNLYRMTNNHKGVYDAQWSTDDKGNFLFAAPDSNGNVEKVSGGTVANREYWKDLIGGKVVVSNVIVSRSTGQPAVVVAAPIKGYNGKYIGTVGNNITLEFIQKTLASVNLSKNSFAILTAQDGTFIVHPDKEYIMNKKLSEVEDELSKTINSLKSHSEDKFLKVKYKGTDKVVSNYNIGETGWTLSIVGDQNELFKEKAEVLQTNIIIIAVVLLAIMLGTSMFIKLIKAPISNLEETFLKASNGDLSSRAEIASKDEFGLLAQKFNIMIEKISSLVNDTQKVSESVLDSSTILMDEISKTNEITMEVAQSIEEISATTEENAKGTLLGTEKINQLSESIQSVSNSINNVANMSNTSSQLSGRGLETIKILRDRSDKTKASSSEVNDIILSVDGSSQKIGTIIQTINEISDQTNLLALNASIEAARAGEAGRGFAVVAEEIRKLAEETSNATQEIGNIINEIQSKSKESVKAMDNSKIMLEEQLEAVNETEGTFIRISKAITELIEQLERIKQDNGEMMIRKDEIVGVIENIAAASEETSASIEEVSASAEEQLSSIEDMETRAKGLEVLARELQESINKFKTE